MPASPLQPQLDAPPRRRRTQEERSAETRTALIEAAVTCLCQLGYERTTTMEIARRASCTTGAVQHHFGSKAELLIAVLDRLTEEFLATYASFENLSARPVAERCRFILDGLWALYNAPRYLSIWELWIGTRSDAELHRLCVQHREGALAACEKAWLAAFPELTGERQRLVDLMLLAVTLLRSVGLNNALNPQPELYRRQIDLLRKFLESELAELAPAQDRIARPQ